MIVKALLAWAGLRAAPHLSDRRVHDAQNEDTVSIAGFRILARQSLRVSESMTVDPDNTPHINKGVADMRAILAETARRAGQ